MADTERTPTAHTSDEASSTSSTPRGTSDAGDERAIRDLGEQILTEIDAGRTNDTLTRWLAHHIADLISRADAAAAEQDIEADRLAHEAETAILQLWQHRSAWPHGWPPPRATEMARLLDSLPTILEVAWHGQSVLGQLHNLHLLILATLVDHVAISIESLEEHWLATFGEHLTDDEAAMLRRAAETDRRIARWTVAVDIDELPLETIAGQSHPLMQLTDTYQEVVRALVEQASEAEESPSSSS